MNKVMPEKEFQKYMLHELIDTQGYVLRTDDNFNKYYALDPELLFQFLWTSQSDEMADLQRIYKDKLNETILNRIRQAEMQPNQGRVYLLKHGIEMNSIHLDFLYTKPATDFNPDLIKKYDQNILSVAEEVWGKR